MSRSQIQTKEKHLKCGEMHNIEKVPAFIELGSTVTKHQLFSREEDTKLLVIQKVRQIGASECYETWEVKDQNHIKYFSKYICSKDEATLNKLSIGLYHEYEQMKNINHKAILKCKHFLRQFQARIGTYSAHLLYEWGNVNLDLNSKENGQP